MPTRAGPVEQPMLDNRTTTAASLHRFPSRPGLVAFAGLVALLSGGAPVAAQSRRSAAATLFLQIRPEEVLAIQNSSVALKIRLARGASARLWSANPCTAPSPESQVITASGTYSIPLTSFAPSSNDQAAGPWRVCLASSDGLLNDSAMIPTDARAAVAASSVNTSGNPQDWTVTSQGGLTTWSRP